MDYLHTLRINKTTHNDNKMSATCGGNKGSGSEKLSNHNNAKAKNDLGRGFWQNL